MAWALCCILSVWVSAEFVQLMKAPHIIMAVDVHAHESYSMHHNQEAFQAPFIRLVCVNGHMGTGTFLPAWQASAKSISDH